MKERSEVGSSAPESEVPKILASVVKIFSPCPSTQTSAVIAAEFRSALAEVDNLPASSRSKKPIAKRKPIVEKLATSEMNLPTVVNEVISGPAEFRSAAKKVIVR